MKRKAYLSFVPLFLAAGLFAQIGEAPNFVRESATFVTTNSYAEGNNPINIFATDGDRFVHGLSFSEFRTRLDDAWASGFGGVIDFDNPVYGDPLLDFDRSAVKAFVEAAVLGQTFDSQLALQNAIEAARAEAYAAGLVDFTRRIPIVNRLDPFMNDTAPRAQGETIIFDRTIGLFGLNNERRLVLSRGPQFYTEGDQATREHPAAEALGTVNDQYFPNVSRGTYGDQGRPGPLPVSLPFSFNGGIIDLEIDPRDNVVVVGFVLLTASNFQYWKGLGAVTDNPDNKRVRVEFSDGSFEVLTSSTNDVNAQHDTFFGIEAPLGASITRIKARVIGRSWRTFVFMDDFAFITAPSAPFIASAEEVSGSAGAPFFYRLLTGQNPDTIDVANLPPGLTYDAATGLISGTPSAAGEFMAEVTLTNAVGTTDATIRFSIGEPVAADRMPLISGDRQASVTLGRELDPLQIETSLDDEVVPGELNFFTLVFRLGDDGSRTLIPLEATGLGLSAGLFTGTPTRPGQVGTYEIEVFVMNEFGGDRAFVQLDVFPVVPRPNFDGDETTDLIWIDNAAGQIFTRTFSSGHPDGPGSIIMPPGGSVRNTGLAASADSTVFLGDIDNNNQTDIILQRAGVNTVELAYFLPDGTISTRSIPDLGAGWEIRTSGDMRGDGFVSVLLHRPSTHHYIIWHLANQDLAWAGTLFNDGVPRDFILSGDFDGNGTQDLLFRRGPGHYELVNVRLLSGTGRAESDAQAFRLPSPDTIPHLAADFTGDGSDDLLWKNWQTGEVTMWIMSGASVPEDARVDPDEEIGSAPVAALPGTRLFPVGTPFEVITALDVDEDQRRDLILQNREDGSLHLLLMDGAAPKAPLVPLGGPGVASVVAAGDFDGDKREDIVIRYADSGATQILYLGPDGVRESAELGNFGSHIHFVSPRFISRDLSLPPGRDDAVAPWVGAHSLGDRWFYSPWFGFFWDPAEGYIFHTEHGFQWVFGESAEEGIWLHDSALEWLWTTSDTYPWLYFPRFGSWIYFAVGSVIPNRWFYESAQFAEWVMESDL